MTLARWLSRRRRRYGVAGALRHAYTALSRQRATASHVAVDAERSLAHLRHTLTGTTNPLTSQSLDGYDRAHRGAWRRWTAARTVRGGLGRVRRRGRIRHRSDITSSWPR